MKPKQNKKIDEDSLNIKIERLTSKEQCFLYQPVTDPDKSDSNFLELLNSLIHKGFRDNEILHLFKSLREHNGCRLKEEELPTYIEKWRCSGLRYSKKSDAKIVCDRICAEHYIVFSAGHFYVYGGIKPGLVPEYYVRISDEEMGKFVTSYFDHTVTRYKLNEVIEFIQHETYKAPDELNDPNSINLRNGILNLNTFELKEHSPEHLSTIQLNVYFLGDENLATPDCPLFLKAIGQILEGDQAKIDLVQEMFGLCLTQETKQEKAFFFIGDGANGKSVLLFVLRHLLGEVNCSAFSLDQLSKSHCIANLFGKLVNISTETQVQSKVDDSTFKAIVSGDPIQADHKFKDSFKFCPYSKLVFALNSFPRVDDKTDAFFRRLIIIRLNRQFSEAEQNKNLKYDLLDELSGIFVWALAGLKRLRERGHFLIPKSVETEINEYRKENNNVIQFVEACCQLEQGARCLKETLYSDYYSYCRSGGMRPLGKPNFGKHLKKAYPQIDETRDARERHWLNIRHFRDTASNESDLFS